MHVAKEAVWLHLLILQVFKSILPPMTLFSDNKSAIALAKDHQYHVRTKHINIRYHFIHWIIEEGKIWLIYCPTEDMIADVFTKCHELTRPHRRTVWYVLGGREHSKDCRTRG